MDGTELPTEFRSSKNPKKNWWLVNENVRTSEEEVDSVFSKKFSFTCTHDLRMPQPETLFKQKRFIVPKLQDFKNELNAVKNELNRLPLKEWHNHTGCMNCAGNIFTSLKRKYAPELMSQAWCKFYEILCSYDVVPKMSIVSGRFNSVHLCEAPGAFVTSLNHYLQLNYPYIKWKWRSNTLNPYYEGNSPDHMINDDRLIMNTFENWSFGVDWTGNLFEMKNVEELVRDANEMGPVNLVTADGSVNCQNDPGEQENIVSSLHYCETIAALNLLNRGGSFVLKVFTMFESETVCLMYLLCCFFESVNVFKPVTSKEGNSESYVVCLGFIGQENISDWLPVLNERYGPNVTASSMFRLKDIPSFFVEQITNCSDFFKKKQIDVLKRNLRTYKNEKYFPQKNIASLKNAVADEFIERYKIDSIHQLTFVAPNRNNQYINLNFLKKNEEGSFEDRQHYSEPNNEKEYFLHCKRTIDSLDTRVYNHEGLHIDKVHVNLKPTAKEQFSEVTFYFKGKRIKDLCNSRFCINELIDIRKKLEVFVTDSTNLLPSATLESYYVHPEDVGMLFDSCKFIDHFWQKDIHENHLSVLSSIKNSLHNLKQGESLYLLKYQLLTLFSVGLLYLLGLSFQYVVFFNPSTYGSLLLLYKYDKNFKYRQNNNIEVELGNIISMMEDCSDDQSVLTLVPVAILCTGEFYRCVTAYNHIMLKVSSLNIINEAKKRLKINDD